jgi:DNA-directed RNA polymerase specialized sigma24 family protein
MSTLDQRLYAWLLESDERKFELAFRTYFSVAFPSLVRHLARLSRWDPTELEEVAQDALLRFFEKVGRARREAAEEATRSLAGIRPLQLGPIHARQVRSWTADVTGFIAASMGFCPPATDAVEVEWKAVIRELTDRIPALQGRGCLLFGAIQIQLEWPSEPAAVADEPTYSPDFLAASDDGARLRFAEILMRAKENNSARAAQAEQRLLGVLSFVRETLSVIRVMPRLRVPTNGYLFEITTTVYLDECKKRGRRKRGGMGLAPTAEVPVTDVGSPAEHPLDRVDSGSDGERFEHDGSLWIGIAMEGYHAVPAVDPTLQYENHEFFEKFSAYLRVPVDAAMETCATAQARGRGTAERRRLESLTAKYSKMMAVLSSIGEGYTQEKTAERLGLTRNQVKYILEQVQDAYATFGAVSFKSTSNVTIPVVLSHAD